ncbi:MAG: carboxypeptidase regulatory-like domain-containing protein [Lysobacterales bacterium]|nr:MAG: carboxypeptidase regulatory-like domain-containing protein [Xanthomonadales bacterium]
MAALRYLVFVAVGLVVASVLFLAMSFIVSANFDAGVGLVERWIVRATCDRYELTGTVRGTDGRPVPYAVVEVSYLDERLATRSNNDGTFVLAAAEEVCDRRPPARVQLLVMADDFRPKTQTVPFEAGSVEVTLDARDFRP